MRWELVIPRAAGVDVPADLERRILQDVLNGGAVPPGVTLRIGWRNPGRAIARDWRWSDDEGQTLEAAIATLNKAGWLSAAL